MKRLLVLAVLWLFALPSFAAIQSITPAAGTVTGGDTITIVVDTPLYSCPICSPPLYEAEVTFGGVAARAVSATSTTITAVTPASHVLGQVDVAVSSHGTSYGVTSFTFYGWGSEQIDRRNYEKVLVPLLLRADQTVPGAFGTLWNTEFWFRNPTPYPVELFNDITCTITCAPPPPGGPFGFPQFVAGGQARLGGPTTATSYGFLYYVQKTYANDVSFALHVRDSSRSAENAGTEIGVVREREFRGASFDILNVPINPTSRAALRVYDPTASPNTTANVSFYSMDFNELIASTTIPVTVAVTSTSPLAASFPPLAGVGQIGDILNTFAFIQGGFPPRVRVHVELKGGSNQSWGFVAVTNNSTQLITTFRP